MYPEVGVDDAYGLDEVRLLDERFHVLLTANGCDVEKIESEWDRCHNWIEGDQLH